jgi:hypothetical protein
MTNQVIQFLSEFECDLKVLFDILREIKLSNHDSNFFNNNRQLNNDDSSFFHCIRTFPKDKKSIRKTYIINSYDDSNNYLSRSMSCKSYNFNSKYDYKFNDYNIYDNRKEKNIIRNKYNCLFNNDNKFKLNFDYDAFLTDYTLSKTNKKDLNNLKPFKPSDNINNYINENKENKDNKPDQDKKKLNENEIDKNNVQENNIFTFSEDRQHKNKEEDKELNEIKNKIIKNNNIKKNNERSPNKKNEDKRNLNNNNKEEMEEYEELEEQKKEIIKIIIPEIIQDMKKLDLLKAELGDDIGEKLISGNIAEDKLLRVVEILKNYQVDMQDLLRNKISMKNRKHFGNKKFNQPSDKILLKEALKDKRYNYREFPRGWNSTKDYFVNNGSTSYKNNPKIKF